MVEDQSGHYPFLTGASDTPRNGDHQHHQNDDHDNDFDENYEHETVHCSQTDDAVKSEISLIHDPE